jgi:hypothetical protein
MCHPKISSAKYNNLERITKKITWHFGALIIPVYQAGANVCSGIAVLTSVSTILSAKVKFESMLSHIFRLIF